MLNCPQRGGYVGFCSKVAGWKCLRQTNPARFPQREAVKSFLAKAIEMGVVSETGDGARKMLNLPVDETTGTFPSISPNTLVVDKYPRTS